jgi:integrase
VTKRANGEGSVGRRGDGNGWQARYCYVEGGVLRRRSIYGRTREEVTAKLRAAIRAREEGLPAPTGSETVADFLAPWLTGAAPTLKPLTVRRYREVVEGYLVPALGRRRLVDLTPQHVGTMYGELLGRGLAPKTVQLAHTVLHRALTQAVRWGKVGRNVTDLVDPPRVPRAEAATLTPLQLSRLGAAAHGHRLEALFVLAMLTGMRRGELLALRWGAVDLDRRVVEVRGTLQRVPGGAVVAEPKSATSRRAIALGEDAIAALRAHRARQAQERLLAANLWQGREDGFVFTNETGRTVALNTVAVAWSRLLGRAGLRHVPFHALRHAATTLTVAANVAPKVAARRLGHASASLTLDRYSHVTDDLERAAAAAVEAVLRQAGEPAPEERAT